MTIESREVVATFSVSFSVEFQKHSYADEQLSPLVIPGSQGTKFPSNRRQMMLTSECNPWHLHDLCCICGS